MSTGYHRPVMVQEVLGHLAVGPGGKYRDCTVGGGGHGEAILEASAPDGVLVGLDRDPEALAEARARLARFGDRVTLYHTRFDLALDLPGLHGVEFDGILMDLGVSSHQIDEARRGFSYMNDGPLDMRMDPGDDLDAAGLLDSIDQEGLTRLLERGEVPRAAAVARAILRARGEITTTRELARVVEGALGRVGRSRRHKHLGASLVFQALRVAVNQELEALDAFLTRLPGPLAPGGRVVVLAYHSLEDRLVKRRFKELSKACTCPPELPVCVCGGEAEGTLVTSKPVRASDAERAANPRARSALLRAWERRGHHDD